MNRPRVTENKFSTMEEHLGGEGRELGDRESEKNELGVVT